MAQAETAWVIMARGGNGHIPADSVVYNTDPIDYLYIQPDDEDGEDVVIALWLRRNRMDAKGGEADLPSWC